MKVIIKKSHRDFYIGNIGNFTPNNVGELLRVVDVVHKDEFVFYKVYLGQSMLGLDIFGHVSKDHCEEYDDKRITEITEESDF